MSTNLLVVVVHRLTGCISLLTCTLLLVEKRDVAPDMALGITANKQERFEFFETQAELENLANLPNLPNSVTIKNPLNVVQN